MPIDLKQFFEYKIISPGNFACKKLQTNDKTGFLNLIYYLVNISEEFKLGIISNNQRLTFSHKKEHYALDLHKGISSDLLFISLRCFEFNKKNLTNNPEWFEISLDKTESK